MGLSVTHVKPTNNKNKREREREREHLKLLIDREGGEIIERENNFRHLDVTEV